MLKRPIPFHYAWLICAGGTLLLFCTGGLSLTAFAAYLPYLKSLRGLTDAQVSAFVFIRSLTGVAGMLLVNRTLRHWEIRRVITAALVGCGLSFVLYGSVESFPGYCAAAALAGISYGFGSMIAVSILIIRWFNTHRGMALGICSAVDITTTLIQFGIRCFLIIHPPFAPVALAARTYSCSRRDSICPRISLDILTQYSTPNTMKRLIIFEPIFARTVPSIACSRPLTFRTEDRSITISMSGRE